MTGLINGKKSDEEANNNNNFEKIDYFRHASSYMYINFYQNQVCRSFKTVHTNLYAKNRKLHKFATCN